MRCIDWQFDEPFLNLDATELFSLPLQLTADLRGCGGGGGGRSTDSGLASAENTRISGSSIARQR